MQPHICYNYGSLKATTLLLLPPTFTLRTNRSKTYRRLALNFVILICYTELREFYEE